jgi:hypothetical protein
MDAGIRQILEFLLEGDAPVGKDKDISYIMNGIFPIAEATFDKHNLERFLEDLAKYTTYDKSILFTRKQPYGFNKLIIALTEYGLNALKKEQDRVTQREANQVSIDLGKSIIATNNAVQNMNVRMLEHAERQEAIMLAQSGFSEQQVAFTSQQVGIMGKQTHLIEKQNALYKFTLILTGVNIAVAIGLFIATVSSSADKELISIQRSQIEAKNKEIRRLQLLKSDTVHYVLHYPLLKSKKK